MFEVVDISTGNYEVVVSERGVVARHLSKRSAGTIRSMWEYKGFEVEIREEEANA